MKKWSFAGSAIAIAAAFALAAVPQMASAAEAPAAQPEQATQQTTPKAPAPAEKPAGTNTKPTITEPTAPKQKPAPQAKSTTQKIGTKSACTPDDTKENVFGNHAYWKMSPDCTTLILGTEAGYTNGTLDIGPNQPWRVNTNNITSVKIDSPLNANADSRIVFANLPNVTNIDLTNFDTADATDMSQMFESDTKLTTITFTSAFDTSAVTDMSYMFDNDPALESLDVSNWDTRNVTNMYGMFYQDEALQHITGLKDWNTEKVTNMQDMFYGNDALTSLDLSGFNTKNVTNMAVMFAFDTSLTHLDFPSTFDTSKVTTMSAMFGVDSNLQSISFDSNFKTPLVTNMHQMFYGDPKLTKLDLSSFDTTTPRTLLDQTDMFHGDSGLEFVRAGGTAVLDNTNNMPLKDWTNEAGSWNGHPSDGFGNSPVMWYGDPDISTATFDANGAQGTAPAPVSIALWPDASTEFTLPGQGNMAKTGYTFLGWAEDRNAQNLDATDSGRAGKPYDTNGASLTLYAVWVKDASSANGQNGKDPGQTNKDPGQNGKKTGQSGKELGATGSTALGVLVAAIALAAAGWGVFHFRKANKD